MINSKEYKVAHKLHQLVSVDSLNESFALFDELFSIITSYDLKGIEIYLWFERLDENVISFDSDSLMKKMDKMFLQYSVYEVHRLCEKYNITRYDCWQRFCKVIYCFQPLVFHYTNEKEFFKQWNCEDSDWV